MRELIVQKNDAGQRLDKFLNKAFPDLPKSMMYKGLRNKKIKVNRKRAAFDQQLKEGDQILLFLPEDALKQKERIISGSADVDVVYEDDHLLIVNKPAGLLSQKDSAQAQDTLNDRILAYLYQKGDYDPAAEQSFVPAICHRLDRNTSGLVAAAKTAQASRAMAAAIRDHQLGKEYLAITTGTPPEGEVSVYLKKEDLQASISRTPKEGYQPASLSVQVLQEQGDKALVHVDLHTGRFHQIRATMADLGHPLYGDVKYGGPRSKNGYALQAYAMNLDHVDLPGLPGRIELPADQQLHLQR